MGAQWKVKHKEAAANAKGKIFGKLVKEITIAARNGAAPPALLMSRQDIADYLGLAIETVSRALGQFQDDGWLVFSSCRSFHILKPSAMQRLAAR